MKNLCIFYFDNELGEFDSFNPRYVMEQKFCKEILSLLSTKPPFFYSKQDIIKKFDMKEDEYASTICLLNNISAIDIQNDKFRLNFPIFGNKDCKTIKQIINNSLAKENDELIFEIQELSDKIQKLYPNVDKKVALYHILCGKVFDGSMFDYLAKENFLKESFPQKDNRDYMMTGYQNSRYCTDFNASLFCSFNNAIGQNGSLSSFGNADGERVDFFRYYKLREKNQLYGIFKRIDEDLKDYTPKQITDQSIKALTEIAQCQPVTTENVFVKNLITMKYLNREKEIIVPIFEDSKKRIELFSQEVFQKLGDLLREKLEEIKAEVLRSNILCVQHKVDQEQLCNEIWHIYFGLLNKYLINKKIVAKPQQFKKQGKYLKCIYLSNSLK